jgi:hypothetical protein
VIAWLQPLLMEVKGKQRGRQPLNASLRIKERTTRESKRHGQVAEHTGGDASMSGRAAEWRDDVRENWTRDETRHKARQRRRCGAESSGVRASRVACSSSVGLRAAFRYEHRRRAAEWCEARELAWCSTDQR